MGLYDWVSGIWGNAFAEQTGASPDRPNVLFMLPPDTARYTSPQTRAQLRRKYEWLWQNFGVVKEISAGVARHAVGKGISVQLNTAELEWNAEAEQQVEEWALTPSRCDLAGRRNFFEAQLFAVESYIGPGEFFSLDTNNPRWNGEPCFQLFDPNEIASPAGNLDPQILDGVRVDSNYVPSDFFIRTATAESGLLGTYKPQPAAKMVHWFSAPSKHHERPFPLEPCVYAGSQVYVDSPLGTT